MRSGTITLPRPEKELLITIRTGDYGSLATRGHSSKQVVCRNSNESSEEHAAGEGGQNQNLGSRQPDVSWVWERFILESPRQ